VGSSSAAGENSPLLGCYAASCGNLLSTFRDDLAMRCLEKSARISPILIGFTETSARNYDYSLGNSPEESSSAVFRGRSLKSRTCGRVCRLFERLSFQLDPCQRGRVVTRLPEADREEGKLHAFAGSRSQVTQFAY
jgi:hypothetical protein